MNLFSRTDTSMLGRWWWTVDRWLLGLLAIIIIIGALLIATASPPVARRIGVNEYHFFVSYLTYAVIGVFLLIGTSFLERRHVLWLAMAGLLGSLLAMVLVLMVGTEIKGARRWLPLPGLALQPSEFMKPFFVVVSAWLMSNARVRGTIAGRAVPVLLLGLVVSLLLLQPDVGMTLVVLTVWCAQLFVAGLPIFIMLLLGAGLVGGLFGAYFLFPHVASRIDRFLDPASGDTYQVDRAQDALSAGGWFGKGIGQGLAKEQIPDVHADFIFAVAAEELGLICCLLILAVFLALILRGLYKAGQGPSLFVALAGSGLIMQFTIQSLINIGSTLHLLPTKGMTLPFISYGGSSFWAMSVGMGMLLALLRRKPEGGVSL